MRLYLSSQRLGTAPEALVGLLRGKTRIAVIANAADGIDPDKRLSRVKREINDLRAINLNPTEVDLRDYFEGGSRIATVLNELDAVWVLGGSAVVLRSAFHHSGADRTIEQRLHEDSLVWAGYSAGSVLLQSHLPLADEPLGVALPRYPDGQVTTGLGLVPFATNPHYGIGLGAVGANVLTDDYIENHIPFIALRDGQALVIDGDAPLRVVGWPIDAG